MRSSATFCRLRVGFSCVTPWLTGLPYTIPCGSGTEGREGRSSRGEEEVRRGARRPFLLPPPAGAFADAAAGTACPAACTPAGPGPHLGNGLLAAAAAHADPIHHVALLGLEAHAAGLVGAGGARQAHQAGQLPELPAPHAQEEAEHIALLLLPQLLDKLRAGRRGSGGMRGGGHHAVRHASGDSLQHGGPQGCPPSGAWCEPTL